MKTTPVAIHSKELNDLVDINSVPQGWDDDWYDDGDPVAPEGWYLAQWPEHVVSPKYDGDCSIREMEEPEYVVYLDSMHRL